MWCLMLVNSLLPHFPILSAWVIVSFCILNVLDVVVSTCTLILLGCIVCASCLSSLSLLVMLLICSMHMFLAVLVWFVVECWCLCGFACMALHVYDNCWCWCYVVVWYAYINLHMCWHCIHLCRVQGLAQHYLLG